MLFILLSLVVTIKYFFFCIISAHLNLQGNKIYVPIYNISVDKKKLSLFPASILIELRTDSIQ